MTQRTIVLETIVLEHAETGERVEATINSLWPGDARLATGVRLFLLAYPPVGGR